jgi:hypothetical protein
MIRENNNHKNKNQSWYKNQIKSNSNGWNWKKKIQNKIYSNQKFEDQIWYNQEITWHF